MSKEELSMNELFIVHWTNNEHNLLHGLMDFIRNKYGHLGGEIRITDSLIEGCYKVEWRCPEGKWFSYKISYETVLNVVDDSLIYAEIENAFDRFTSEYSKV